MVIEQVKEKIKNKKHFLIAWWAWSWKTYTLLQVIDLLFSQNKSVKIACITYTKVAVKEIKTRCPYKDLWVSTIHEFLWDTIKPYQKNIVESLINLIEAETKEEKTWISFKWNIDKIKKLKDINYRDYQSIENWVISHDDVLKISNYMFSNFPLLCRIIKDKFDFILVDEYQDTNRLIIELLLESLYTINNTKPVFWFFGDSMQSIYWDEWIWNLNDYTDRVDTIIKNDNWRCSKQVINLINHLRDDNIIQSPSGNNKEWDIKFLYSYKCDDINKIKKSSIFNDWDFSDWKKTKELYLTHNLISDKAWYKNIFDIYTKDEIIKLIWIIKKTIKDTNDDTDYSDKKIEELLNILNITPKKTFDPFILENPDLWEYARALPFSKYKKVFLSKEKLVEQWNDEKWWYWSRDTLIKHLWKIQTCIEYYKNNKIKELLENLSFKIKNIDDRTKLKNMMEDFINYKDRTIEEMINLANEKWLILIDDRLKNFMEECEYVYNRVKWLKYYEYKLIYDIDEWHSPYSTQHWIKWAEFDNVFIVLDNWKWFHYNFQALFDWSKAESILERTRKIFYVSCSRSKDKLVVFYYKPTKEVIEKAEEWFWKENLIDFDSLEKN